MAGATGATCACSKAATATNLRLPATLTQPGKVAGEGSAYWHSKDAATGTAASCPDTCKFVQSSPRSQMLTLACTNPRRTRTLVQATAKNDIKRVSTGPIISVAESDRLTGRNADGPL